MLNDRKHRLVENGKRRVESGRNLVCLTFAIIFLLISTACVPDVAPVVPTDKAGLYDVDASGTDLKFVLEALAKRSGANIVISPEVIGEVSIHLKQMPIDSILDCLATVQGFGWKRMGDAYLVATKERFAIPPPPEPAPPTPPEPEACVWECKHIKPADLIPMIGKLFPSIQIAEGPNSVTPTFTGPAKSVTGDGGGDSASSATETVSNSTRIVLYGSPSDIAKARDVISKLDVARQQVAVDVAIMEIGTSANKDVGIDWSWSDMILKEAAPANGIRFGKFTKEGMTFTGVVSAMLTGSNANLLAQPNISVIDGESADILIGDRLLFPKLVGYSQYGTPIYDKDEEKVGIYLQIAPKVTGDDEILLTLYPQVSLVTKYLKTQAGDYPQISTREARTTVSVKNGVTLAIGGLLREDEIKDASKIPLLGDLPIIGQFFRHSKTTKERTEIVILLTPRIVEEDQ